ncbi:MAG: hypothetical protein P4M02_05330 [Clostridia bacterium]|nr:hypothetical protein [Clostridia bacterium]
MKSKLIRYDDEVQISEAYLLCNGQKNIFKRLELVKRCFFDYLDRGRISQVQYDGAIKHFNVVVACEFSARKVLK